MSGGRCMYYLDIYDRKLRYLGKRVVVVWLDYFVNDSMSNVLEIRISTDLYTAKCA